MSYRYQRERDAFIGRMSREGLPVEVSRGLLRAATTLQRLAELACSSEAADRDRVPCPGRKGKGPCLCDYGCPGEDEAMHDDVPRIAVRDWNTTQRARALVPARWQIQTQGDPRGYVLRVIPPRYAERNTGRSADNLDAIGVPTR